MTKKLILASGSNYRQALLKRLNIPFKVQIPNIDETPLKNESASKTALRLSEIKAKAVASQLNPAQHAYFIIGSDQVAVLNEIQIGKPGSFEKAFAQLKMMRGQTVQFHSALCLLEANLQKIQTANILTTVKFRQFSDQDAQDYLQIEQPFDIAGSAKSEGLGITLIESIQSNDPTALIGLPLIALTTMLVNAGFSLFQPNSL